MKSGRPHEQTLHFRTYARNELGEALNALAEKAEASCAGAYAPYSGFRVGAAALLDDGTVVTAANQESVSFPAGLCAERALLFSLADRFPGRKVKALLVVAEKDGRRQNVSPCGICRQTLADMSQRQGAPIEVLFWRDGRFVSASAYDLLPFSFSEF